MDRQKDYYAALGVGRAEGVSGIQEAYRRLAKQCHPDRAGEQGTGKFQEIQEAYEVLSDPRKRESYDASLARQGQPKEVAPEPLVPSRDYSGFGRPEPLIRPSSTIPEDFTSITSSLCVFCDGLGRDLGFPCLFCQEFEAMESGTERLLLNYLRAFRS
ncbi:MAG: Chaperone protein DnaJ [Nitrospira sp.]|jgi:curved DNA-binding protein CbpA|nr:MAG: Chaperone protein DnaJ [Nitrospira sp.]